MKLIQSLTIVADDSPLLKYPQMWKCTRCERIRQWGHGPALEPKERPKLLCSCQNHERHVPHTYAGLKEIE